MLAVGIVFSFLSLGFYAMYVIHLTLLFWWFWFLLAWWLKSRIKRLKKELGRFDPDKDEKRDYGKMKLLP